MCYQPGIRTELIKTITSTFNWRIKNIEFMRKNEFSHKLMTREVKFENSDFKWFAEIADGLEDTENNDKKQLHVKIFRDQNESGCYEKRTFDVKFRVKKRNHEKNFEKQGMLLHNKFNFTYFGFDVDYTLMDISFEVRINEYDITGSAVKSFSDINYKLNVLKDMKKLHETGKNADMVLVLKDESTVLVHKDFVARSPYFRNMIDMKLTEKISIDKVVMEKYLKFIYTGELANDTNELYLSKLSEIAEMHQFAGLKNICNEILMMKVAENKMKEEIL